jgi:hypothetical protein
MPVIWFAKWQLLLIEITIHFLSLPIRFKNRLCRRSNILRLLTLIFRAIHNPFTFIFLHCKYLHAIHPAPPPAEKLHTCDHTRLCEKNSSKNHTKAV